MHANVSPVVGDRPIETPAVKNPLRLIGPAAAEHQSHSSRLDHFIQRDGKTFAGTHLIVDFWDASRLDQMPVMEEALREAVRVARATLLHLHLHHFSENGGISGVAVLAESHISVHTWPELDYAAFDVFMCGDSKPHEAVTALESAFQPQRVILNEHDRGLINAPDAAPAPR